MAQQIPPDFSGQGWTDQLAGSPFVVPTNGTVTKTFQINPATRAIICATIPFSSVAGFNVVGGGTGLSYLLLGQTQPAGIYLVPIIPSIDTHILITATAGASAPLTVFVASVESDISVTPGFQGNTVAINDGQTRPVALLDGMALPTSYEFGALLETYNGATLNIARDISTAHGSGGLGVLSVGPVFVDSVSATYRRVSSARSFGDGITGQDIPVEHQYLYNGTTYDHTRGNMDTGAVITAVAATTTQNSADQLNSNGKGVVVFLNMTNVGTGSVTPHIQGKDTASGNYYDILVGTAITTNAFAIYHVYPSIAAIANVAVSDVLTRTWRVQVVANNANATTYTVSASVLV